MSKQRAWLYARGSMNPHGLLNQINRLITEVDRQGFDVVGVSSDTIYHRTLERYGLRRMLKAIRNGEVDVVVVERVGKLSHRIWLLEYIIRQMERHQVALLTTEGNAGYALYRMGISAKLVIHTSKGLGDKNE